MPANLADACVARWKSTPLQGWGPGVRALSPAPDFLEKPKLDEGPPCQRAFRFSGDALRWSRQQRDFTSRIQLQRCRLQAQEFAAAGCEAMSDTASQRPQKSYRSKPVERIFFSRYFFPSQGRAARFSPSADVIAFWRLTHLGAGQNS